MNDAYKQGSAAYRHGFDAGVDACHFCEDQSNPYPVGSDGHDAFEAGWMAGYDHALIEDEVWRK